MKDLHDWHVQNLTYSPCFEIVNEIDTEKDPFLQFMKNTDEGKKVQSNNGNVYYCIYRRIMPKIITFDDLMNLLKDNSIN